MLYRTPRKTAKIEGQPRNLRTKRPVGRKRVRVRVKPRAKVVIFGWGYSRVHTKGVVRQHASKKGS